MNQKMRKLCFLILAAVAVSVTGCSGRAEETAGPIPAAAEAEGAALAEETQIDETNEINKESLNPELQKDKAATVLENEKEEKKSNSASVGMLTGTVAEATADSVTVVSERYPDGVTFKKDKEAAGLESELVSGGEITLFYIGEIKDGGTDEVSLLLVRDKRNHDAESQAAMVSGKILAAGMSVITIETDNGQNISFEQDPKPVNLTDGPAEGEAVTIVYSYRDEGGDGGIIPELILAE